MEGSYSPEFPYVVFPNHVLQVSPAISITCTWMTSTPVFPTKAYGQSFQPVKANAFGASLLRCSVGSSKVTYSKLKSSLPLEMFSLLPCSLPEQRAPTSTGSPSQNPKARGFYLSCVFFTWRPRLQPHGHLLLNWIIEITF